MPIGTDLYYNNYSLGGARLVQRQNIYCEYVRGGTGDYSGTHKVYHRYYCEYIPRDENGFIVCSANHNENQANVDAYNNGGTPSQYKVYAGSKNKYPNNSTRQSSGIVATLINEEEARRNGFYPCRDCCM